MRTSLLLFLIISSMVASGCSVFTRPMEKPVIKDTLSPSLRSAASVGMLSLTPERRIVLQSFKTQRFCAEAPTEVGVDLSSLAKATASADIPEKAKAELGIALANASGNTVLNKRSQGMQLFLANSYFVCQMYMNDAITARELLGYQTLVFNSAASLIAVEIPFLYNTDKTTKPNKPESSSGFEPVDPTKLDAITTDKKKDGSGAP